MPPPAALASVKLEVMVGGLIEDDGAGGEGRLEMPGVIPLDIGFAFCGDVDGKADRLTMG